MTSTVVLHVPETQRRTVRGAFAGTRATRLFTQYFDTAAFALWEAGITLRLERRGRRWMQILERRDGPVHEAVAGTTREPPPLDPARHSGASDLDAFLAIARDHALLPVFTIDVRRRQLDGITYEEGAVHATAGAAPLRELSFADPRAAAGWVERHGVWLDMRPRIACAFALARGEMAAPAVRGGDAAVAAAMSPDAALRAIIACCLAHALPNAGAIAAGAAAPEHLHQLRVGLRRLRTALREFGDWSGALDPAWEPGLQHWFARLGAARDRDAIAAGLLPRLAASGAPRMELPAEAASEDAAAVVRDRQWTMLMLELAAFASDRADFVGDIAIPLVDLAGARLRRLHRRIRRDAAVFAQVDDESRHRTRKRLKRLRYSIEFMAPLFRAKRVRRYLRLVRPAQEALGTLNDLSIAEVAFRTEVERDPRAWYAIGWIAAERPSVVKQAAQALEALAEAPRLWRKAKDQDESEPSSGRRSET